MQEQEHRDIEGVQEKEQGKEGERGDGEEGQVRKREGRGRREGGEGRGKKEDEGEREMNECTSNCKRFYLLL